MKLSRKKVKKSEIEIVIPKKLWNALKYIAIIFCLSVIMWVAFYQPSAVIKNEKLPSGTIPETTYPQLTPQQQCQNEGNIWCNGKCYTPCPSGQRFNCPPTGEPTCIITRSIEDIKKSIVYIRHDVTGCCDSYGQISSRLGNAGSGIIYNKDGNNVTILTTRHVVDCVFAGTCIYPINEKITIRTQSGRMYTPTNVWYAPKNLDLAILEFQTNEDVENVIVYSENYKIGDDVAAIGYPTIGLDSPEPILEFSITEGKITNMYNLLTYQGLSFKAIQSDALTGHGASGGGLFNQDGHLLGIITWGDREEKITLAIDSKVLEDINSAQEKFIGCPSGSYKLIDEGCCPYGTISSNGKCYEPCGQPNSICPSPNICCNNVCYTPCPSGYVLGSDCVCHQECAKGHYCSEGFTCCNEQCISCPPGSFLGTDCKCYSWV